MVVFKKESTSSNVGIDSCAPDFVTANDPIVTPIATDSTKEFPFNKYAVNPALKASPAATVSTALTFFASINPDSTLSVSYTHLTLPTICSV